MQEDRSLNTELSDPKKKRPCRALGDCRRESDFYFEMETGGLMPVEILSMSLRIQLNSVVALTTTPLVQLQSPESCPIPWQGLPRMHLNLHIGRHDITQGLCLIKFTAFSLLFGNRTTLRMQQQLCVMLKFVSPSATPCTISK